MNPFDLIIKGGTIVTAADIFKADIGIRDGRIAVLGTDLAGGSQIIDASGKLVLPGGIDSHVHIDEPPFYGVKSADDFHSGTVAAACGGNTTIIPFAEQVRGQSLRSVLDAYHAKADGKAVIDYAFHIILVDPDAGTLGQELPALIADGYTSYKLYMTYDGLALGDRQMLDSLQVAKEQGAMIMIHAENDDCIHFLHEKLEREGKTALKHFPELAPDMVEREATHRAISLGELIDTPVLLVHVSSSEAMEQIKWAQDRGLKVYGETCPQYLFISTEDIDKPGWEAAKFMCAPPPRGRDNQDAIWRGLTQGIFQVLSSDHCAFRFEGTAGKKKYGTPHLRHVPPGVPGIELRLPLVFSEGVNKGRIDLNTFVAIASTNAAKIYGLYPQKGTLAPGSDADITIWDPELERTVTIDDLHDNMDFTPYEGMMLKGWPVMTLSRGEVIWSDGEVTARPGRGKFLKRAARNGK